MASIEAKPTIYRNILYRSRLEARWAVYLHHHPQIHNVKYEPRSYGSGRYTPDFQFSFLSDLKTLEVKPANPNDDYLKTLLKIVKENALHLYLAIGSFYNEVPIVYELRFSSPVISIGYRLNGTDLFNHYALNSAAGYRFDLQEPEHKRRFKGGSYPPKRKGRFKPF